MTNTRQTEHDSSANELRKRLLILLTYLGFLSLGLPDSITGIVWPSVSDYFEIPLGNLGILLIAFFCGYITSSLSAGSLLKRIGIGDLLASSCLLVLLSLLGFSFSQTWTSYLMSGVVAGLGAGAIDSGLNAYAARHFSARHMSWLHAFWGIGATVGALITTFVLRKGLEWQWAFRVIAITIAPLTLGFAVVRNIWDQNLINPSTKHDTTSALSDHFYLALRHPIVWVQSFIFFLYVGIEATVGQWSYTLLTQYRGTSESTAGIAVTLYWASLTLGRLLLGAIADQVGVIRLIRFSVTFSLAGGIAFVFAPWVWVNIAGLLLLGASFASIYPGMMSQTPARLGQLSETAIGFQVTSALLGQVIIPSIGGLTLKAFGLTWINSLLGALLMLLWVSITSLFFRSSHK